MNNDRLVSVQKLTQANLRVTLDEIKRVREVDASITESVRRILGDVKSKGDQAVIEYSKKFDSVKLEEGRLRVSDDEVRDAYKKVTHEQVQAIRGVKQRIESVEKRLLQRLQGTLIKEDGITIISTVKPVDSVGCYVPGGQASYPSSLMMTVVPAKVAGVPRVVVCSPLQMDVSMNPLLLVAANICGVDEFYRVGGAQAIGAMAYGTDTIDAVSTVVGPGNIYVTEAKKMISDRVVVDCPAGPTEILVVADGSADPVLIVKDLVAQAEHGETSICGLVTNSESVAEKVSLMLSSLPETMMRRNIISKALSSNGFILVCEGLSLAVDFINSFAPEHLEIVTSDPNKLAEKITNSALVLIGPYSPAAASDYVLGTNHVLPTSGYAKTYSGLSIINYVRRVNIVQCSKEELNSLRKTVGILAESERLPNHAASVEERFK